MDAGRLVQEELAVAAAPPPEATVRDLIYGGRFQIGERLGAGLTGEIFKAVDGQTGGQVAVKLVANKVFSSPLAMDRTQRELKQLAKVTSDRLLKIIDSGKAEDTLFVATELFPGKSLEELGRGQPMSPSRAAQLTLAVGEALLEAQKVGESIGTSPRTMSWSTTRVA